MNICESHRCVNEGCSIVAQQWPLHSPPALPILVDWDFDIRAVTFLIADTSLVVVGQRNRVAGILIHRQVVHSRTGHRLWGVMHLFLSLHHLWNRLPFLLLHPRKQLSRDSCRRYPLGWQQSSECGEETQHAVYCIEHWTHPRWCTRVKQRVLFQKYNNVVAHKQYCSMPFLGIYRPMDSSQQSSDRTLHDILVHEHELSAKSSKFLLDMLALKSWRKCMSTDATVLIFIQTVSYYQCLQDNFKWDTLEKEHHKKHGPW